MVVIVSHINKDELVGLVEKQFPQHPFESEIDPQHAENLMSNYLAMSQAFPYLQAGSQYRLLTHYMNADLDVPEDVEVTTAVGNFLCFDEVGAFYETQKNGVEALPEIVETKNKFHSRLLKLDLQQLFGKELKPSYSDKTKNYLKKLFRGLSSIDPVERCSYMVSFEIHAERMINSLWKSLEKLANISKDNLIYFKTHVGGPNPAEEYHVAMTTRMIEKLVPPDDQERFVEEFISAYTTHIDWCASITK